MRVTLIPIVIGELGTVSTGLVKGLVELEIGGRMETIVKISKNTEKNPLDLNKCDET